MKTSGENCIMISLTSAALILDIFDSSDPQLYTWYISAIIFVVQ